MARTNPLEGKKIAFVVANEGIEQVELTGPWQAVQEAGGTPVLIAPEPGSAQAFNHLDKADKFPVDITTDSADYTEFAGVVLPGGVANPDTLRTDGAAVKFVTDAAAAGTPIAAICHGPWTLIEAGLVAGKTLTSWPSLKTDIRNAGGHWQDEQVVTSRERGWTLITSRKPADLDAFNAALVKAFAE